MVCNLTVKENIFLVYLSDHIFPLIASFVNKGESVKVVDHNLFFIVYLFNYKVVLTMYFT